jgi:hypothetical protein
MVGADVLALDDDGEALEEDAAALPHPAMAIAEARETRRAATWFFDMGGLLVRRRSSASPP